MQLALSSSSPKDEVWEKMIRNTVVHHKHQLRQGSIYRSGSVSHVVFQLHITSSHLLPAAISEELKLSVLWDCAFCEWFSSLCPGGDHAVGFASLQICPVQGGPRWQWVTLYLEPSELQKGPCLTLNICMPLLFMCFCVRMRVYWLAWQPTRPAGVHLLCPSLSFVISTLAIRCCKRGAFPTGGGSMRMGCGKLMLPTPTLSPPAGRSAYQLLWGGQSPKPFLFCGLRSSIIILSW